MGSIVREHTNCVNLQKHTDPGVLWPTCLIHGWGILDMRYPETLPPLLHACLCLSWTRTLYIPGLLLRTPDGSKGSILLSGMKSSTASLSPVEVSSFFSLGLIYWNSQVVSSVGQPHFMRFWIGQWNLEFWIKQPGRFILPQGQEPTDYVCIRIAQEPKICRDPRQTCVGAGG